MNGSVTRQCDCKAADERRHPYAGLFEYVSTNDAVCAELLAALGLPGEAFPLSLLLSLRPHVAEGAGQLTVRARPGPLRFLSVFHSESCLHGVFCEDAHGA